MSVADSSPARTGYFATSLVVLVLDQLTKVAAHAYLPGRPPVVLIPGWFNLTYSRNRGGLFGYFSELGAPWRTVLLTLLPLLAIGLVATFLIRGRDEERSTLFGLSLILGGAVGNVIDRIFRGEVVDFLDVYLSAETPARWLQQLFGTSHWPTFNIADSAIVVGAGLLLVQVILPPRAAKSLPAADPTGKR